MANARTGETTLCPWRQAPRVNAHDHLVVGHVQVLTGDGSGVDDRKPLSFTDVALIVDARTVAATQTGADGSFMLLMRKTKKTKSSETYKRQRQQQVEFRILKEEGAPCGQVNVTWPSSMQWGNYDEPTIWEEDLVIDQHVAFPSCMDTELTKFTKQHAEQARVPAVSGLGVCIDLLQSLLDSQNAFPFDEASRGFRLVFVSMGFLALFAFASWRRRRVAKTQQTGDQESEIVPITRSKQKQPYADTSYSQDAPTKSAHENNSDALICMLPGIHGV